MAQSQENVRVETSDVMPSEDTNGERCFNQAIMTVDSPCMIEQNLCFRVPVSL